MVILTQMTATKTFEDGQVAEVWPMTFGKGKIILMPYEGSMDVIDGWCYESIPQAMAALEDWQDPEGEPEGWFRNPTSGRRRPDGDAKKEYVRP